MLSQASRNTPAWYVLNFIGGSFRNLAEKAVERFNAASGKALRLFAPTYIIREQVDGQTKIREANLTFHYVFVRGTFEEVKSLCAQPNGLSFLIDRGNAERYATIPDSRMAQFITIARAYKNCLPYFSLDDIDLEDGDLVEVVRGDFPGLVGTYMPNPKSKTGSLVLGVYNKVGTVVFNVNASDVRVLEFSKNFTRANDQIDAFVPHLLAALRSLDASAPLCSSLAAKLAVFCGRMEVARLNNRKLDARLQILLYAANLIIGNSSGAAAAMAKYRRLADAVTNPWTAALVSLILAVTTADRRLLADEYARLLTLDASSKARRTLLGEYAYYLSTPAPSLYDAAV